MRRSLALVAALAFGCREAPPPGADAATADRPADAALNDLGGDVTDAGAPADAGMDAAPPPTIEPFAPNPRGRFPLGFLWGSATAPYQIEGGLGNTDWGAWERMPGRILGGDRADNGPRSFERFAADLDALVASGQNSYRLGIEWARIFPTRDAWMRCQSAASMPLSQFTAACRAAASAEGVAYYHRVLRAMADRRLVPMVTLQHFTLPDYLHDINADAGMQGWNRSEIINEFAAWARFAGAEYGAEVDWWVTINEPVVTVAGGFLQGVFPPGRSTDFTSARIILRHMTLAHARAYDALHEAEGPIVLRTDRVEEFAPIKNATGEDSPATSKAIQCERAVRWLREAGIAVPLHANGQPDCVVEISPLTATGPEDLRANPPTKPIARGSETLI